MGVQVTRYNCNLLVLIFVSAFITNTACHIAHLQTQTLNLSPLQKAIEKCENVGHVFLDKLDSINSYTHHQLILPYSLIVCSSVFRCG